MCGIAGILEFKNQAVDPALLGRMVASLEHRGPDDTGIYAHREIGLAHARLSIIDLEGGRQPMSNADGSVTIAFNGEIFNYIELRDSLVERGWRFKTCSDTEVILKLYEDTGEELVHKLNGQWAFAIWDAAKRQLFLARDRLGIRPLFYAKTDGALLFASEIKALFASGRVERGIDSRALDQIFTFWFTLPSRTFFEGVRQLPPGCFMRVQDGRVQIQEYWRWSCNPAEHDFCDSAASQRLCDELVSLLQDATRIRLRSDVPVGAYLSGGIDSSLVTALINRIASDKLKTFSIAFEDSVFDESAYQRAAAAHLNTEHEEVRCEHRDIVSIFPQVIWHTEQPIVRTAPAPMFLLARRVHDRGFKVVLTGEGADEVLGGYDIFKEAKIRRFWSVRPDSKFRPLLLKRLYPYMPHIQNQSEAYLKSFFSWSPSDVSSPFFSHLPRWQLTSRLKLFFSDALRAELGGYDAVAELGDQLPPAFAQWPGFCQSEFLEARYLLPGYILSSQGDRMAMAHAVEARHPFLDYRLVEFASRLPVNLKMRVLTEKYLLKRAAVGLLPPEIVRRSKQPYRAPDGRSFFGPSAVDYLQDVLSPESVRDAGIFAPQAVTALVNKFKGGRAIGVKDNMGLTGILSTQLVFEQFIKSFHPQGRTLCRRSNTSYALSL